MRNFKNRTVSVVLGGVMAGGLLVAGGSPAAAASCSITAGNVLKTGGGQVTGYGAWTGSGCGYMKIKIQRKVLGIWDTVNDDGWNASGDSSGNISLPARCSGTHTWRVWLDGEKTDSRTGPTKSITC
ncbi:hypothetical protein IAG44_01990 [Streptomyces roseirectus]|uniref:Secreted protein n=1 Tax=Streptomyces roseirectus TaxID=2768066 RepID=A0A7H0I6E6_9ACTN|nr:hypothetical protein [Streptomyces roseirectus]QNP68362.1 hypothetical protein IAG44_01990 [Streptomyces roseirectus]